MVMNRPGQAAIEPSQNPDLPPEPTPTGALVPVTEPFNSAPMPAPATPVVNPNANAPPPVPGPSAPLPSVMSIAPIPSGRGNVGPQNAANLAQPVVSGIEGAAMSGFNAIQTGFSDIFNLGFNAGANTRNVATGNALQSLNQTTQQESDTSLFGVNAATAKGIASSSAAYILPGGAILHGIGDVNEGASARLFDVGVGSLFVIPGIGAVGEGLGVAGRAGIGAASGAAISGIGTALRGGTPLQDLEAAGIGAAIGGVGSIGASSAMNFINTKGVDIYTNLSNETEGVSIRDIGMTIQPSTESTDASSIEGVSRGNPPRYFESNVVSDAGRGGEIDYISNMTPKGGEQAPGGIDYSNQVGAGKYGKPIYGVSGRQMVYDVQDQLSVNDAVDALANRTAMLKANEIIASENLYGDEFSGRTTGFRESGGMNQSAEDYGVASGSSEPMTKGVSYETRVNRVGPDVKGWFQGALGKIYGKVSGVDFYLDEEGKMPGIAGPESPPLDVSEPSPYRSNEPFFNQRGPAGAGGGGRGFEIDSSSSYESTGARTAFNDATYVQRPSSYDNIGVASEDVTGTGIAFIPTPPGFSFGQSGKSNTMPVQSSTNFQTPATSPTPAISTSNRWRFGRPSPEPIQENTPTPTQTPEPPPTTEITFIPSTGLSITPFSTPSSSQRTSPLTTPFLGFEDLNVTVPSSPSAVEPKQNPFPGFGLAGFGSPTGKGKKGSKFVYGLKIHGVSNLLDIPMGESFSLKPRRGKKRTRS